MNVLLSALAAACREHRFREKILVTGSMQAGYQLIESVSRGGIPWLNLRPITPLELARRTAAPELAGRDIVPVSTGGMLSLLEEVTGEMAARGELRYFGSLPGVEGLSGVLYGSLAALRLAGVTASEFDPSSFVDLRKGREIRDLLAGYEKRLDQRKWADPAALYRLAEAALQSGAAHMYGEALFMLPGQLELERLPFQFLERLTGGSRLVLPADPVYGLDKPAGFSFHDESNDAEESRVSLSPLSWLYRPGEAPAHGVDNVRITRAYGAANEVRALLRIIKAEDIALDQSVVCHTGGSVYGPLFFAAAASLQLPVTFGEGIPVSLTRPGRAALNFIRWLDEDCSAPLLYRILVSGDLHIEPAESMARLLRRAGIGWGRDRYRRCLDSQARSLSSEAALAREEGNEALASSREEQSILTLRLAGLVEEIFEHIPVPDNHGRVDFDRLCRGLAGLVEDYTRCDSETDSAARAVLLDKLAEAAGTCPEPPVEREALARLKTRLERLSAGASPPRPGHLHVTGFRDGETVGRPHTFVVGLDTGSFPGTALQDPVLLDTERMRISPALSLRAETPERNLYRMARFLASRRGRLYLSFPCYDVSRGQASFPSAILLQIYRLQIGCLDANYTALLQQMPDPAGYLPEKPESALAPDEWWLSMLLHDRPANVFAESIAACYPGLAAGLAARQARSGETFSTYDGRVAVDPHRLDPRLNRKLSFSATQLEYLARCPFAYFIRYVLRVMPPEEYTYDPGQWLDALTRGSLLHEVYSRYLRELFGADAAARPGRERLLQIANEEIAAIRSKIPPPGEAIFETERDEMLRGLDVFLRVEAERQGDIEKSYLEVPFGVGDDEVDGAGLGIAGPVSLDLPGGAAMFLRGRIDRLDRLGPKRYQVWDYKTGGARGYTGNGYLKQGRQLQHALYARAAEEILRSSGSDPEAKVNEAGYIFPTEKGEGFHVVRLQDREEQLHGVIALLLDLLAAGTFCAAGDRERCAYCDYTSVCRYPEAVESILIKLEHPANIQLQTWKELQKFE